MISTTGLVELPDPGALETHGAAIVAGADRVVATMDAVKATWTGLSPVYSAPEVERVFAALDAPAQIADLIRQAAINAQTALDTFAANITTLQARRANLLVDVGEFNKLDESGDPDYRTEKSGVTSDISTFNRDYETADAECAHALEALMKYQSTLPLDLLDAAGSQTSEVAQGLAAAILERYRTMYVPKPGDALPYIPRTDAVPDLIFKNDPYTMRPNGLFVPQNSIPVEIPKDIPTPAGSNRGFILANPDLIAPPKWVKGGGRVLGAAGIGLGVWGAYTDQYNEDNAAHPEWDEGERVQSATTSAVVVGGSGAVGGAGGAWAGAAVGAAIGSIFPGPGTIIGGVIGGIAGGMAGGWAGSTGAEAVMDEVKK